jgi:hypothetical protein
MDIADFLAEQLGEREERLRGGWYGDAHFGMLRTRLILGAWVVSRQNGVSSALSDRIVDAGLAYMRELFDEWQRDYAVPELADIAAKRRLLALWQRIDSGVYSPDANQVADDILEQLLAPYGKRAAWTRDAGWRIADA